MNLSLFILKLSIASICSALVSAGFFFDAKTFSFLLKVNDGFVSITVRSALYNIVGYLIDDKLWTGMERNWCHL